VFGTPKNTDSYIWNNNQGGRRKLGNSQYLWLVAKDFPGSRLKAFSQLLPDSYNILLAIFCHNNNDAHVKTTPKTLTKEPPDAPLNHDSRPLKN
jgi:hypothetical protein